MLNWTGRIMSLEDGFGYQIVPTLRSAFEGLAISVVLYLFE